MLRLTLVLLTGFVLAIGAVALTRRGGGVRVDGDPMRGEVLFKGYCASCHILKAVGSTARFGPNLDILKPSYAQVVHQIETGGTGGAGLPATARLTFGPGIHEFTTLDIHDIAAFVVLSTR
jgi:mono/diheme cytochrome c family protein